jgi:hypothetical protein
LFCPRARLLHRGAGDFAEGVVGTIPFAEFGMKEMRQQFGSFNHARAGPGEIRICVDGENTFLANGGQIAPTGLLQKLPCLFNGFIDAKTTRHDD